MLGQIQEILHIEKGGEKQLTDELNAYNPLNRNKATDRLAIENYSI